MRRLLCAVVLAVLLGVACNDSTLLQGNAPSHTATPHASPSVTHLPTPTGSPVVPFVGDHDCGNADYQAWDPYDPDDGPGAADAYWCYWLCAVDPGDPVDLVKYPPDPFPPHEVLKEYDYDPPSSAYQFGPTVYLPCYAARP